MTNISEQQRTEAIKEWLNIKQWMEKAKERELILRVGLADTMFERDAKGTFPEGTAKTEIPGFKVKMVGKINRAVLEEAEGAVLAELGADGMELVKREPKLSMTAYNKLSPEKRAIADKMLVAKPGTLELEITPIQA